MQSPDLGDWLAQSRLDGFTVCGGYADGFGSENGNGGGIYCSDSIFINCTVVGNRAEYYAGARGGGIACQYLPRRPGRAGQSGGRSRSR